MSPDQIIELALARGTKEGLPSLSPVERQIWLISEAEVYCDMEGIDSFLSRYPGPLQVEAATAFQNIGASEIGAALLAIHSASPEMPDQLLNHANDLICIRANYNYNSIVRFVNTNC